MSDVIIKDRIIGHLEAFIDPYANQGKGRIVLWNRETRREIPCGGYIGFEVEECRMSEEQRKAPFAALRIASRPQGYALYGLYQDGENLLPFALPGTDCSRPNPSGSNLKEDVWGTLPIPIPQPEDADSSRRARSERFFTLIAIRQDSLAGSGAAGPAGPAGGPGPSEAFRALGQPLFGNPSHPDGVVSYAKSGVERIWP
ncbi:MAG: hypothetical protein B7733_04010 [Myxococcales bacterium FL481]|nr:MAG: hypothetical protein B7733_04010 [Myxococcales bacterium FL481]